MTDNHKRPHATTARVAALEALERAGGSITGNVGAVLRDMAPRHFKFPSEGAHVLRAMEPHGIVCIEERDSGTTGGGKIVTSAVIVEIPDNFRDPIDVMRLREQPPEVGYTGPLPEFIVTPTERANVPAPPARLVDLPVIGGETVRVYVRHVRLTVELESTVSWGAVMDTDIAGALVDLLNDSDVLVHNVPGANPARYTVAGGWAS